MKIDVGLKLVEASLVSEEDIRRAQKIEREEGGSLCSCLVKLGVLKEEQLLVFLSELYETQAVNLDALEVDPAVVRLVPPDIASKFQIVPIARSGRTLRVAAANPANCFAVDDIKFVTGHEVQVFVTTDGMIRRAIDKYYDSAESMADVMKTMEDEVEIVESVEEESDINGGGVDQAPVVKFVNSLISDAVRRGASDIHIEPYEKKMRVRFRVDGTLAEMPAPPSKLKPAIVSRLKIMADLDIAEKRVPQDGRIKVRVMKRTIDLRVSTLPTIFGEKIVMRILDKGNLALDLTKLGFEPKSQQDLMRAISQPYGMVLVTGPTGSGKTTTLYSALTKVNVPGTNIMTAEDPVEYNLDGINQVNIHEAIGLTFPAALKSFLRQDPNIIMVGEIRDGETASIAVKAALTGHLVLSTVHTNDAASTLNRLVDMGTPPFLVASSVILILAQRLVRRICAKCREEIELSEEILNELQLSPERAGGATFYRGAGCYECGNSGYRGRAGIYEVMPVSPNVRDMILDRRPSSEIKRKAISEGMLTLRMDALEKLMRGVTTVEEVLKESTQDDPGE